MQRGIRISMEKNTGKMLPVWEYVRGLEKASFCDWPGHIAAVLFLGGCNLRCPTCHNAALAWTPNEMPLIKRETILRHIEQKGRWLDGIVVTGGEPTIHEDLPDFLAELRQMKTAKSLPLKLDTNGMNPDSVERILADNLADVFAVDVKGPFALYPALTGNAVDEAYARHSLERIFAMAAAHPERFYFRTTLVPALSATDIDIVKKQIPSGFSLILQKYVSREA